MSLFYFLPDFLAWWYGRGLKDFANFIIVVYEYLVSAFSLKTIFKTFFAPWKRMVEKKGRGIDAFFYNLLDNVISRGVAITMRVMLIIVFCLAMILFSVLVLVSAIGWFIMPALPLIAFLTMIGKVVW